MMMMAMMMMMMMMMIISDGFTPAKTRACLHRVLRSKAAPFVALLTSLRLRVRKSFKSTTSSSYLVRGQSYDCIVYKTSDAIYLFLLHCTLNTHCRPYRHTHPCNNKHAACFVLSLVSVRRQTVRGWDFHHPSIVLIALM